jgi:bacterioferritin-associated ferredoxin
MFVCLCNGITSHAIQDAIDAGARTTKDVEKKCGAGSVCGRCRHTVRVMLLKSSDLAAAPPPRLKRRWAKP